MGWTEQVIAILLITPAHKAGIWVEAGRYF